MELSVETNTGKVFEVAHAVATSMGMQMMLYIEFIGYGMMDIVPVFSDTNETSTIYGYVGEELNKTFIGYTILGEAFIVPENGNLRIRLDKPMETETLGE